MTLTHKEFLQRLSEPRSVLVDVMPEASFAAGHLPGALSLPLEQIEVRASDLLRDKDADILVYCSGPD